MDQVDEIRKKIDIVSFISEYIPLKKAGRNFKALCPFHSEKAPSFIVSPERQIWKCFGCGEGGDAFSFLMKIEGMEFGEALRVLAKRTGVKLVSYRPSGREAEKEKLYSLNYLASEFYHYLLVNHPVGKRGLGYLLERGIKKDSIKRFKLGFAPPLWDGLQRFLIGKKGYKLEDLKKAGLLAFGSGKPRDFFRERIIFPLKDHRGNVVGFSGRVLPGKNETAPKYINIAETLLYQKSSLLYGLDQGKEEIRKKRSVIVVEGEFDVISSFQANVENIVAIKGSSLTFEQCQLLKRFADEIILALDRDIAGDAAARRGIETADSLGFELKVVELPEGKDPDELAQKSKALWQKAVKKAMPVYDFFISSACSRFDKNTSSGKKRIGEEVLPVLKKITNDLVRAHYVRFLAKELELPEEALFDRMEKIKLDQQEEKTPLVKKEEKPSRRWLLEEHLLSLFFQTGKEKELLKKKFSSLFETQAFVRIIQFLKKYFKEHKKFSSETFAKTLPSELVEIFNGFFLADWPSEIENDVWREKEAERTVLELERVDIQEKLKSLAFEISLLEKKGKQKTLNKKKEEFRLLSQRLSGLKRS